MAHLQNEDRVREAIQQAAQMLRSARSKSEVVVSLVAAGWDQQQATHLVDEIAEELDRRTGFKDSPIDALLPRFGSIVVVHALIGWLGFNNVRAFDAGYDDCRWGEPTESQCGFGVQGTARGKIFGSVMYGPGFLLGKALAPND